MRILYVGLLIINKYCVLPTYCYLAIYVLCLYAASEQTFRLVYITMASMRPAFIRHNQGDNMRQDTLVPTTISLRRTNQVFTTRTSGVRRKQLITLGIPTCQMSCEVCCNYAGEIYFYFRKIRKSRFFWRRVTHLRAFECQRLSRYCSNFFCYKM